jgi:hypothetical protein
MKWLSSFLLLLLFIRSSAQDTFPDSTCCKCSAICTWDTIKEVYADVITGVPFSGTCRENYYYKGEYASCVVREYREGKILRKTWINRWNKIESVCEYSLKDEEVNTTTDYDSAGRIRYIGRYMKRDHKSLRFYKNGKLVSREKGVDRFYDDRRNFERIHEVEWDSAGRKSENSFYRQHTTYFPRGLGHDRRGWEVVFREDDKRCFRIRRTDSYVKKVCVMPRRFHW